MFALRKRILLRTLDELHILFNEYLALQKRREMPRSLYEPFEYIVGLGGKRTRPLLVLMGCEMFGRDAKEILPQAYAVELFHNFTLVHDDIMDNAALRRGAATVHEKFGLPPAILSGDVMLVYAYRYLAQNQSDKLPRLMELFNAMAIGICEGQQMDVDFEARNDVSVDEYIRMIEKKTALLLGTALQIGAVLADASEDDAKALFGFGINTGIAFQLLDDLLDVFGDAKDVGKTTGGDIVQNKKTVLYVEARHQGNNAQRRRLNELYNGFSGSAEKKIAEAKRLFEESNALERARALVTLHHDKAMACLNAVSVDERDKRNLVAFSESLMQRTA